MELFGIVLSIPGAFIASGLYRFALLFARLRWPWIQKVFLPASCVVLTAILAEWLLLATRGSVGTRVLFGSHYYLVHLLIFFLGTPALLNVLVLPNPAKRRARWWFAVPVCTALAFILVLQQYVVSESLYGIDGNDGPFSQSDVHW